jgi:hypothetical protein
MQVLHLYFHVPVCYFVKTAMLFVWRIGMGRNASLGKHLLLIPCRVHINFILKRHVILNSIYPAALQKAFFWGKF